MATISSLTTGGALQNTDRLPVARLSSGTFSNVSILGSDVVAVDNTKGLAKDAVNNKLSVKLATGGGLMFDTSGDIKLAPAAASSSIVAVRPSDTGATDNQTTIRTTISGELRPCFKTVTGASEWASNNLVGNVTIYVDEDTIEGSDVLLPTTNGSNIIAKFFTQVQVDTAFGIGSGLKAGMYIFTKTSGVAIRGQFNWHSLSSGNTSNTTFIRGRFKHGTVYETKRYFDEEPRSISFNVYISNDKTLLSTTGLGTNPVIWKNILTNDNDVYIRNMGSINNSRMEFVNINLISRSNANDITVLDISNSSTITLRNVTLTLLGDAYYNFHAIRIQLLSTILAAQEKLYSRVTNTNTYPGYALAIIGNKNGARDRTTATKLANLFKIFTGASIRLLDYSPFKPNDSRISTSIILDGDFVFNSGSIIRLETGNLDCQPCFINNNSKILPDRFSWASNVIAWSGTPKTTLPIRFTELCQVRVDGSGLPLRLWTLDSSTNNTSTSVRGIPSNFINTDSSTNSIATFNTSDNRITYVDTDKAYSASFVNFNDNYCVNDSGVSSVADSPILPYLEIGDCPDFNTYYNFTESGTTYSLAYGATQR